MLLSFKANNSIQCSYLFIRFYSRNFHSHFLPTELHLCQVPDVAESHNYTQNDPRFRGRLIPNALLSG